MLGNLSQLMNIMKNAGAIKQSMEEMNERLAAARFTGEAGGGQVQATVNGKGELVGVKIEPKLVQAGDAEMIEELTVAAVRDAAARSRESVQREMQELTGGLGLGDIGNMLSGGQG
jgi:DNA-binding YbaB/EbfC family protein